MGQQIYCMSHFIIWLSSRLTFGFTILSALLATGLKTCGHWTNERHIMFTILFHFIANKKDKHCRLRSNRLATACNFAYGALSFKLTSCSLLRPDSVFFIWHSWVNFLITTLAISRLGPITIKKYYNHWVYLSKYVHDRIWYCYIRDWRCLMRLAKHEFTNGITNSLELSTPAVWTLSTTTSASPNNKRVRWLVKCNQI